MKILKKNSTSMRKPQFWLFTVLFTLVTCFSACKKDLALQEVSDNVTLDDKSKLKNPITAQMAQSWFEANHGKVLNIAAYEPGQMLQNFNDSSSLDTIDANRLSRAISVAPEWSLSEISTYLRTNPILYVPVLPIPYLDSLGFRYKLVFFRENSNQLNSVLQLFQASEGYAAQNSHYQVNTFTGLFAQIRLDGGIQRIFTIENGAYKSRVFSGYPLRASGSSFASRPDGCYNFGRNFWQRIGDALADLFGGSCSGDGGSGSSGSGTTVIIIPRPLGTTTGFTGGGFEQNYGGGGGGTNTPPAGLWDELDNSIFRNTDIDPRIRTVVSRLNGNTAVTAFLQDLLAENPAFITGLNSALSSTVLEADVATRTGVVRKHVELLMEHLPYRNAWVQSGFSINVLISLKKYTSYPNDFTKEEFAGLFVSGHLYSSDPIISFVITKWWLSKNSIQREQFRQGFANRAGETYEGFVGYVNFYTKLATTSATKGRFCFGGNCGNDLPKIPYLDSDIFSSFLEQYKNMILGAKNGDNYAQGQLMFEAAMFLLPIEELNITRSLTGQVSSHVFRGTSLGYQGSRQMIEAAVTSVAIDPLAATVFALESSNFGTGVLHIVPVNTLKNSGVKVMEGNWLKEVEREVVLSILPTETANAAEITISHTRAKQILRDMGFNLPSQIRKDEITETLRQLPRMTEAQIQEFIMRAR